MQTDVAATRTLVLGLGNILLSDDGIGVHVLRALSSDGAALGENVALRDGGTIGMALLAEIEDLGALIAIDATELGATPGTVRTFRGAEMDHQLRGNKKTAHEVALADLMAAAQLSGHAPERRALIGIQPATTQWGLAPTEAVASAIPAAMQAAQSLIEEWGHAS